MFIISEFNPLGWLCFDPVYTLLSLTTPLISHEKVFLNLLVLQEYIYCVNEDISVNPFLTKQQTMTKENTPMIILDNSHNILGPHN
jgi:hypothetical protein